jgi:hypothetical protein
MFLLIYIITPSHPKKNTSPTKQAGLIFAKIERIIFTLDLID